MIPVEGRTATERDRSVGCYTRVRVSPGLGSETTGFKHGSVRQLEPNRLTAHGADLERPIVMPPVMEPAQRHEIVHVGATIVGPVLDVMSFGARRRNTAAGKPAALIAACKRKAHRRETRRDARD